MSTTRGILRPVSIDWSRFALELGYYDQADFVRDFGAAVGTTPTQYEQNAPALVAVS